MPPEMGPLTPVPQRPAGLQNSAQQLGDHSARPQSLSSSRTARGCPEVVHDIHVVWAVWVDMALVSDESHGTFGKKAQVGSSR